MPPKNSQSKKRKAEAQDSSPAPASSSFGPGRVGNYRPGTIALRETRRLPIPHNVWDFHDLDVFQAILDGAKDMYGDFSLDIEDDEGNRVSRADLKSLFVFQTVRFYTLSVQHDVNDMGPCKLTVKSAIAFMDRHHEDWKDVVAGDIDAPGAQEEIMDLF